MLHMPELGTFNARHPVMFWSMTSMGSQNNRQDGHALFVAKKTGSGGLIWCRRCHVRSHVHKPIFEICCMCPGSNYLHRPEEVWGDFDHSAASLAALGHYASFTNSFGALPLDQHAYPLKGELNKLPACNAALSNTHMPVQADGNSPENGDGNGNAIAWCLLGSDLGDTPCLVHRSLRTPTRVGGGKPSARTVST